MKKQLLIISLFVSGVELSAAAGLTSGQINLLKAVPGKVIKGMMWNGSAIVPAGSSSASTVVNNGGSSAASSASVPTMAQLQAEIASNPAGVAKAAMQALQELSQNMNLSVPASPVAAAYIAG